MKATITLISAVALLLGACSTSSNVSSSYVDDIYFSPGDVPPPVALSAQKNADRTSPQSTPERVILSEVRSNNDNSRTLNNYILDGKDAGTYSQAQMYNLDQMELVDTDTTVYYNDNEVKYVINNYFEPDDISFSYRINRFYRPFGYLPFYNDYYMWDSWYYPYSYNWHSPWSLHYSWHSPYSWYSPYSSWYSPYYYGRYNNPWGWGGNPYYAWGGYPYYGSGYWGNISVVNRSDYRYNQRRDFNTSAVYGNRAAGRPVAVAGRNQEPVLRSATIGEPTGPVLTRPAGSISGVEGGGRPARNGQVEDAQQARTHTELRRDVTETSTERNRVGGVSAARSTNQINTTVPSSATPSSARTQYTRPATTNATGGSESNYTPSYNQQRTATRSTYNVQATSRPSTTNTGTREAVTTRSTSSPATGVSRSSSATTRAYQSGTTYNRSATGNTSGSTRTVVPSRSTQSTVAPARTTSTPVRSSGSTYSTPSRSSSPSMSSPSSSGSGGSSSGSSSGGGSSSSSGRR